MTTPLSLVKEILMNSIDSGQHVCHLSKLKNGQGVPGNKLGPGWLTAWWGADSSPIRSRVQHYGSASIFKSYAAGLRGV